MDTEQVVAQLHGVEALRARMVLLRRELLRGSLSCAQLKAVDDLIYSLRYPRGRPRSQEERFAYEVVAGGVRLCAEAGP